MATEPSLVDGVGMIAAEGDAVVDHHGVPRVPEEQGPQGAGVGSDMTSPAEQELTFALQEHAVSEVASAQQDAAMMLGAQPSQLIEHAVATELSAHQALAVMDGGETAEAAPPVTHNMKEPVLLAAAPEAHVAVEASSEANKNDGREAIWEPAEGDVLSGRGASVNSHKGNQYFRALCFSRKLEFVNGNLAAKRRVATEIVVATKTALNSRFLKKKDKGPWYEMTFEQAILKASQVMRDHRRPDRVALREMAESGNRKRRSKESTPTIETLQPVPPQQPQPVEPLVENPFGVHDHDILSGRGAYVNGHVGNQRLRDLARERKARFDVGCYTEKRALATEIVDVIRSLDPPGRFLKRVDAARYAQGKDDRWILPPRGMEGAWEELSPERCIHKACQAMRDLDRPDRKERDTRRKQKKAAKEAAGSMAPNEITGESLEAKDTFGTHSEALPSAMEMDDVHDSSVQVLEADDVNPTVEEAVAATEAALDKALQSAGATEPLPQNVDANAPAPAAEAPAPVASSTLEVASV